jgi:hypothetical protein
MTLTRRLDEVDRKFSRRRERPYDAPLPWWFRYSFVWPLPLVVTLPLASNDGGWWWAAPIAGACLLAIAFPAIFRWDRAHKVAPKANR